MISLDKVHPTYAITESNDLILTGSVIKVGHDVVTIKVESAFGAFSRLDYTPMVRDCLVTVPKITCDLYR